MIHPTKHVSKGSLLSDGRTMHNNMDGAKR
jgi:hypothetical protein